MNLLKIGDPMHDLAARNDGAITAVHVIENGPTTYDYRAGELVHRNVAQICVALRVPLSAFNAFDQRRAESEGWGAFECESLDGTRPVVELCTDDNVPEGDRFADDDAVLAYVERMAKAGSEYHATALGFHRCVLEGAG